MNNPQNKKKSTFMASLLRGLFSTKNGNLLVKFLEKKAIKAVLKKLLISGGLKGWIISFVIGEVIEKADEKLLEPLLVNIGFVADVIDGKQVYRRINDAENRDDWRDAVRNS